MINVWNFFWEGLISGTLLSHSHKYTYFRKCCLSYDLIILYNIDASYLTMRPHPNRCRKGLREMFSSYEQSSVNSLEQVITKHFHYSLTKENIKACYKICITKFYLKQSINITLYSNIPQIFSDFHHTWTKNKQNNFFFTQFFLKRVDRQGHCSHEAIQQKT